MDSGVLDYYWNMLDRFNRLEGTIQTQSGVKNVTEVNMAKAIIFSDLIRLGIPFNIEMAVKEEKKSSFLGISVVSDNPEPQEDIPDKVTIKDDTGMVHSIPCSALQKVMRDDYLRFVLKRTGKSGKENILAMDISVPDIDKMPEEKKKSKKKKEVEEPVKIEEPKDNGKSENRLPDFGVVTNYPKDANGEKAGDSFLYNAHKLDIDFGARGKGTIMFYVYPLQMARNSLISDVMVVAEAGGLVRAAISRGTSSSVHLIFDDYTFVVRGRWKDGAFISQVNSLNPELVPNIKEKVRSFVPQKMTSRMYMHQDFDGADLYIFPAKFGENGASGYAPSAMVIATDADLSVVTPTAKGNYVLTASDGHSYTVDVFWAEVPAVLRCSISKD